jgi:hypothetical protein
MRMRDALRSLERPRQRWGATLARAARIGLALSLVLALLGVHSALARAERLPASEISASLSDLHQHGNVLAMDQAAHLAGHLTAVVDPAIGSAEPTDAMPERRPIPVDLLPRSTPLPAPSEPPRA